jgi:pilus assembly protein CpaE
MPEKILIVDDDTDTIRLVGMMLEKQGYLIFAANNGKTAISSAKKEIPDLILLDVMMPGIDGFEVTRMLRADPETGQIPIILFTAKSEMDDKLLGFELGADDYLVKPVQTRELLARVKAVLARSSRAKVNALAHQRGHLIAVISPKGGLGVTTVALNIAVALSRTTQQAVIAADFRPGYGSLGLELGYSKPEGLKRLLQRKSEDISRSAVEGELVHHVSGIRLLLSASQPSEALNPCEADQFEAIARQLSFLARHIVIDLGPGYGLVTDKIVRMADEILMVIDPIPNTVAQGKALIQDLVNAGMGEGRIQLILVTRSRSNVQLTGSQIQDRIGQKLNTVFTPDPELAYLASNNNVPIILQQPESLAAQQFLRLANEIHQRSG